MRKFAFALTVAALSAYGFTPDAQRVIHPVRDRIQVESLNGTWDFRFQGEEAWRRCRVPGTLETQGFLRPRYQSGQADMTGCYHRVFNADPRWKGRHVILRFDGVLHEYDVRVNGRDVGGGVASYCLHQFDITDALRDGANDLDVTVRNKGYSSGFNRCDDWDFAGIVRDVSLFSVADEYIEDIVFRTKVEPSGDAEAEVRVKLASFRDFPKGGRLNVFLSDPERRHVADFTAAAKAGETVFRGRLTRPDLWTAETPNLHVLVVELTDASGAVVQRIDEKVGVREVRIEGRRLLVNNRPVKLRGVCLNETDPLVGRAFGYRNFRDRLTEMKRAHVNYIRTAHYPFAPVFYELAAEMGFYLVDEVPLASCGRGILGQPEAMPYMRDRTVRAVRRDRNCPAVTVWSVGNEHPYYPETVGPMLDLVREMDPTRPRTLPHPKPLSLGDEAFAAFLRSVKGRMEILSAHYHSPSRLERLMTLTDLPIIQTEFGHAMGNGFNDFQGNVLQFMDPANEQLIGGSVWLWHDQGVLNGEQDLTAYDRVAHAWPPTPYKPNYGTITPEFMGVWTDPRHFIDTHGEHGTDGIVYANGYPKESWQLVRKMYAPVAVTTNGTGGVVVRNLFDFRSLAGFRLLWNGGGSSLSAPARGAETVAVAPHAGAPFLELKVVDPVGESVYETSFRTDVPAVLPYALATAPDLEDLASRILLKVGRKDGLCSLCRMGKAMELANDKSAPAKARKGHRLCDWRPYLLKPVVSGIRPKDAVRSTFTCTWFKDDDPAAKEFFTASFTAKRNRDGTWKLGYVLEAPKESPSKLQEIGFAFASETATRVDWDGLGPWTSTPGKDFHVTPGVWALHKDDIRFDGNRSDVRWAMLSDGKDGFVIVPKGGGNVSFENIGGKAYVSCNVHVVGYGSKFGDGQGLEPIRGKRFSGVFEYRTVRPRGLGAVVPDRPFFRHYGW